MMEKALSMQCPVDKDRLCALTTCIREKKCLKTAGTLAPIALWVGTELRCPVTQTECRDSACAAGQPCRKVLDQGGADDAVEMVNHPQHYGGDTPYEVIKVLEAWLTPEEINGFCKATAITYLARAGKKPENPIPQEIDKAVWYLNRWKFNLTRK